MDSSRFQWASVGLVVGTAVNLLRGRRLRHFPKRAGGARFGELGNWGLAPAALAAAVRVVWAWELCRKVGGVVSLGVSLGSPTDTESQGQGQAGGPLS